MPAGDLTDTAIILADEKLLLPVLTSLPASIGSVNVTMGHPFRFTSLYSFLKQLMSLITVSKGSKRRDLIQERGGDHIAETSVFQAARRRRGRENGNVGDHFRQYDQDRCRTSQLASFPSEEALHCARLQVLSFPSTW